MDFYDQFRGSFIYLSIYASHPPSHIPIDVFIYSPVSHPRNNAVVSTLAAE